ncbi:hypothetical protein RBH29_04845 [Herbivorax sp. ANBcel31]|uniref:hypothetical protein n=1 Tax=Herbivorax sp. ANBcel31 TaxID=3069754 RepID=UPI0027B17872|nr:hypothetical protein [Herbivorax sp. ANBcel31]MDQ2085762.1 hypothetical protein [Herbivorax sp. ANBcel31]
MKKLLVINLLSAIFFIIILKISGPCLVAFFDGNYGWPKIYGIEFSNIEISWQVLLIIMIALIILYLITIFMMLFTIIKFKKLSLKLSKNQLILIFLGLFLVLASVTITIFEREKVVQVGFVIGQPPSPDDYKSISVDEFNKGYVILEKLNEETTKMKASSKAIEAINRVNSEERPMYVSYRKNILLQTKYKISGILVITNMDIKERVYYMQYFRRRMDFDRLNLSHGKIFDKYDLEYRKKRYLERKEKEQNK